MGNTAPEPDVASGTGSDSAEVDSSAETLNTDSQGGPPETVPYSRFKEVNDRYTPFRELEKVGYDADSLRQLAVWNSSFTNDPVGTWLDLATKIDGMPDEVRSAIEAAMNGESVTDYDDESEEATTDSDEEMPEWARDIQERQAQADAREAAAAAKAEEEGRMETLNWILKEWDTRIETMDLEPVDEKRKLSFIAGAAGTSSDPQKILDEAFDDWMNVREGAQSHIHRSGPVPTPKAVPGGAAVTGADKPAPKTFEEANQLAFGAWENL